MSNDPVKPPAVRNKHTSSSATQERMSQSQNLPLESVFRALFARPFTGSARDAVQLLSGKATHIASMSATPDQCFLYLKATALHVPNLMAILHDPINYDVDFEGSKNANPNMVNADVHPLSHGSEQRLVSDVIQAAGCAVTQCRHRSDISKSGIIPVLAQLAISCQEIDLASHNLYVESVQESNVQQKDIFNKQGRVNNDVLTNNSQSAHVLTASHTELLQACISAGHYTYACQFTDRYPVLSVQPYKVKSSITAEQYLRYFYLLGMARLGLRRYHDAKLSFETCLTMPSHVISAIAIECCKKYLLVKCILLEEEGRQEKQADGTLQVNDRGANSLEDEHDSPENDSRSRIGNILKRDTLGRRHSMKDMVLHLPKSCSPVVIQYFKNASTSSFILDGSSAGGHADSWFGMTAEERVSYALDQSNSTSKQQKLGNKKTHQMSCYRELVNEFIDGNYERFDKIKRIMEPVFKFDGNWGLVNQVQDLMMLPQKLKRVVALYEEIPLSKLAKKLHLSNANEAEAFIRKKLIEQETILLNCRNGRENRPYLRAIIDQEEGVVRFPLKGSSSSVASEVQNGQQDLSTRIEQCMKLTERMKDLDLMLSTSHKYNGEYNAALKYRAGVGTRTGV